MLPIISHAVHIVSQDLAHDQPAPILRFTLYWRDNVVLLGLIAMIVGIATSVFFGAMFFAALFAVGALVLLFSLYYVSRYSELKSFQDQLTQLSTEVQGLREIKLGLEASVQRLNGEVGDLRTVNVELRTTKDGFAAEVVNLKDQIQLLHNLDKTLADTQAKYNVTLNAYKGLLEDMRQTNAELAPLKVQVEHLRGELVHLTAIRESMQLTAQRLELAALQNPQQPPYQPGGEATLGGRPLIEIPQLTENLGKTE